MSTREFDSYLRGLVTAGWADDMDGDVEAPTGHFALVEVPHDDDEFSEMESVGGEAPDELRPEDQRGWYVVREDSSGLVWPEWHLTKRRARRMFDDMADEYADWADQDDED